MGFAFSWPQGWDDVAKLAIAYVIALPVGWHREREAHSVGVRTFPVVAVASCGYVLLGSPSAGMSIEAQSRIIQGMVAGIGFIGGGACGAEFDRAACADAGQGTDRSATEGGWCGVIDG